MENNQQHNRETETSNKEEKSFSNQQPGQQLPTNYQDQLDTTGNHKMEQHSESSKPENENETLGTP